MPKEEGHQGAIRFVDVSRDGLHALSGGCCAEHESSLCQVCSGQVCQGMPSNLSLLGLAPDEITLPPVFCLSLYRPLRAGLAHWGVPTVECRLRAPGAVLGSN